MKYSVEIERHNPAAMIYCLKKLENGIPDFDYDWNLYINAGGIDYGTYINIDISDHTITLCNQPDGDENYSLDNIIDEIISSQEEE